MSIVNSSSAQASNWKQLSYFRVFVENDAHLQNARYPLLNNKRQQLRVTVRLAARDASGNLVTIPQSDLDNIRLIDYNTSALIDFNNSFTGDWTSSRHNQGYTWDRGFFDSIRTLRLEQPQLFEELENRADVVEAMHVNVPEQIKHELESQGSNVLSVLAGENMADCPNGYQCVQFYVSTGARAARRLAARLTNSDGTVFRSNYSEVGDDLGEGDKRGKFNSSFEVDPVTFPNLPNDHFGDRRTDGSGYLRDTLVSSVTRRGLEYRAFEAHVNIRMPNGRKVPIKSVVHSMSADPILGAEVIWACRGGLNGARCTYTYMCYPGETQLRMGTPPNFYGWRGYTYRASSLLKMAFADRRPRIVHARAGEVVIGQMLTSQNSWFYHDGRGTIETPNYTNMPLSVIDIYGTQHNFRLSLNFNLTYLNLNKV